MSLYPAKLSWKVSIGIRTLPTTRGRRKTSQTVAISSFETESVKTQSPSLRQSLESVNSPPHRGMALSRRTTAGSALMAVNLAYPCDRRFRPFSFSLRPYSLKGVHFGPRYPFRVPPKTLDNSICYDFPSVHRFERLLPCESDWNQNISGGGSADREPRPVLVVVVLPNNRRVLDPKICHQLF